MIFRDHALSDQIGFHYQRYQAAAGGGRPGRQAGIDPARRGGAGQTARAGEHHSRRRELLGILRQRRPRFPASAVPAAGQPLADQAGAGERLSRSPSARQDAGPSVRRQLDQPQLRHLDRPSGLQPGLGPAGRNAVGAGAARERQDRQGGGSEAGLGRDVHRRGKRLVLVVRRPAFEQPGLALRPVVPQAPAKRVHAAGPRSAGGAAQADRRTASPGAAVLPAHQSAGREGRRPGHVFRVAQRRHVYRHDGARHDDDGRAQPGRKAVFRIRRQSGC